MKLHIALHVNTRKLYYITDDKKHFLPFNKMTRSMDKKDAGEIKLLTFGQSEMEELPFTGLSDITDKHYVHAHDIVAMKGIYGTIRLMGKLFYVVTLFPEAQFRLSAQVKIIGNDICDNLYDVIEEYRKLHPRPKRS